MLLKHQRGKKCAGNQKVEGGKSEDGTQEEDVERSNCDIDSSELFEPLATTLPKTTSSYFCRLCGDIVSRETMNSHISEHAPDLYKTAPDDDVKLTLSRASAYHSSKPSGTCYYCGLDASVIDKIKLALKALSQGHTSDLIV